MERPEGPYPSFERGGRGYAQFSLGASSLSALGAETGVILRADAANGTVRVAIADVEEQDGEAAAVATGDEQEDDGEA